MKQSFSRTWWRSASLSAAGVFACSGALAAPPVNDNVANAVIVGINGGTFAGTTVESTNEGNVPGSCFGSALHRDVWYKWTSPANTTGIVFNANTCAAASIDTILAIYTGATGPETQVGCSDDDCGTRSTVTLNNLAPNTNYWVRVNGFGGSQGTFTLNVSSNVPPPPPPPPPGCLNITVPSYPQTAGPNVIVGVLYDLINYGTANVAVPGLGNIDVSIMALGTISCNMGNRTLLWVSSTNYHPVIGQNLYRYKDGRFEQIGMSWLKHGFTALANNDCGSCGGPSGPVLGINCSDPYSGGLNGGQGRLGPRYQVNASTGIYPYPYDDTAPRNNAWARRMLSKKADVDPAQNVGARYVVEGQYVTRDDAGYGTGKDSVSLREVLMRQEGSPTTPISLAPASGGTQNLAFNCDTYRREAAINAWKALDPQVVIVPAEYNTSFTYTPPASPPSGYDNSGAAFVTPPTNRTVRFLVGARVTDNGNGTWHYEYAIQNVNSDRSGRAFAFKMNPLLDPVNVGFSAPFYHSGEPVVNTAWAGSKGTGMYKWSTNAWTGTLATDNATNALRWGTMYNYRFDLAAAPVTGSAKLYLFKPSAHAVEPASFITVSGIPVPPPPCAADLADGAGNIGADGFLTGNDFDVFINAYFNDVTNADGELIADLTNGDGTGGPDGFLTGADFDKFVNLFFNGC